MNFAEYSEYDAIGLAQIIRTGEISAAEALEAAIERVERHNQTLNSVVYKAYEEARLTTKSALPDGPFSGVPFLVKDLGCPVADWPLTAGSRYLKDFIAPEDGILTRKYRESGVVLMGKTNTPEFGLAGTTEGAFLGKCRNPWNPDYSTGGSSGGSAAAVASGMVPIAHGNDGLGSIRIPAACCGLFGMKTTRDRNPSSSADAERSLGMSVDHVITRSVRDSAIMLDATGQPETDSPFAYPGKTRPYGEEIKRPPAPLRILFHAEIPNVLDDRLEEPLKVHPEILDCLVKTAALLESLGHYVEEGKPEFDFRQLYQSLGFVTGSAFSAGMAQTAQELGREPTDDELEPMTRHHLETGRKFDGAEAMRGWSMMRVFARQILRSQQPHDVILTPVLARPVPALGYVDTNSRDPEQFERRQIECFPFAAICNITGQPAMSVPMGHCSDGLPIGMMFAGRYGDEGTLFQLAAQLEEARPWARSHPPVWG